MECKGLSAVIGMILMLAITIALACTVFLYVNNMLNSDPFNEKEVYGMVIDKFRDPGHGNFLVIQNISNNKIMDIDVSLEVYYLYDIGNYYDSDNIRYWG